MLERLQCCSHTCPHPAIHLAVQWLQEGTSAELSKFTLHPLHPLHTILVPQWAVRAIFHARPECLMTESFRLLISAFSEAEAFSSFESVFEMSKDLALPLMNAVSAGLATLRSSRLPSSAHIDAVIKSLFSYEGANAAPVRELPASCKVRSLEPLVQSLPLIDWLPCYRFPRFPQRQPTRCLSSLPCIY